MQFLSPTQARRKYKRIVSAQALDNQWLPDGLLQSGKSLIALGKQRSKYVRNDFLLTLMAGDAALINRAFFLHDSTFTQLARSDREALRECFNEGWIMTYLFREDSLAAQDVEFSTNRKHAESWDKFVADVDNAVVTKLDPVDPGRNLKQTRSFLSQRFHSYLAQAYTGDTDTFANSLHLPPDSIPQFRSTLQTISQTALNFHIENDQYLRREAIYQQFICEDCDDDSQVAEGRYRKDRVALAVKKLTDLAYARNLTDAYGADLITGFESPDRTALQEFRQRADLEVGTASAALDLLENIFVDDFSQQFRISLLDQANLSDLVAVRRSCSDEFDDYFDSLANWRRKSVQDVTESISRDGRREPVKRFAAICHRLAERVARRQSDEKSFKWLAVSYSLQIGGRVLGAFTPWGFVPTIVGERAESWTNLAREATSFRIEAEFGEEIQGGMKQSLHQETLVDFSVELSHGDLQDMFRHCHQRRAREAASYESKDAPTGNPPEEIQE